MKISSEELRQKVVQAVERGMPKSGVARLLGISPSSDRRYARTARRRESLAPKGRQTRRRWITAPTDSSNRPWRSARTPHENPAQRGCRTTVSATNLLPSLQAAFGEGRTARYQAARSPAYLRYNTPDGGQASQVHPGASRPRQHKHHPRHVLSRHRWGGRRARGRYGRCTVRVYCCHWGFRLSPEAENSAYISRMRP
jgi:transposase-like protein